MPYMTMKTMQSVAAVFEPLPFRPHRVKPGNVWAKRAGYLFAVWLAFAFAACDSGGVDPGDTGTVRLVLKAQAGAMPAKADAAIQVETAKLLLKTVKFTEGDGPEEVEYKTESFVVSLDPAGTASTVAVGEVPAGTYKRINFNIHKPEDSEPIPDPAFREGTSGDRRFSVIVEGKRDGVPFVLKVRKSMDQRIDFAPPLELTGSTVTVTLVADVANWFVDEAGRGLDPLNPDHHDAIAEAIKRAFRLLGTNR